jgi:hypothetical protein
MERRRMRSYLKAGAILLLLCPFNMAREADSFKISLEEVLSIGSLDDDSLYQWVGVAVDSEKNIYVTDSMDYSLKKFDKMGALLKTEGRRGQGPGEFTAPRLLSISGEDLYVTEQYQPVIKVFGRDLNFKFNIPLKGPVGDIKALDSGLVAVAVLDAQVKSQILFCDRKGDVVKTLTFSNNPSSLLMDMVSFDLDAQGCLYLAYVFRDKIEMFDEKGTKLWSKSLLGNKKVERKKIGDYVLPTEIVFKDIALDASGRIYVLGGHLSQNRSRDVHVLSPEGRLLTTFILPESSHCIYIDQENFLYSRANEGVTLKKYRMVGAPSSLHASLLSIGNFGMRRR